MSDAHKFDKGRQEPNAIQPHGWLIACDDKAMKVMRHSANLESLFPDRAGSIIGANLNEFVGSEAAHALRNALARFAGPARPALLPDYRFPGCDGAFDLTTSRAGDETLVEIERAAPNSDRSAFDRTRAMVDRIAQAPDIEKLLQTASRLIFSVLQYDRVSILRFEGDGSTRVLAQHKSHEAASGDPVLSLPSHLHTRHNAERMRVIADQTASPAPILSAPGADPADLTTSHLRAAANDERDALRRGGFVSSLSMPLIVDGGLWGVVLCQDREPQYPSMDMRAAAEIFGDFLSLHLQVFLQKQALHDLAFTGQPAQAEIDR